MDVGMIGNGAIAALVAITAPSGYVEPWAGIVIGAVAGVIVVVGVLALDRVLDDPVGLCGARSPASGALSAAVLYNPRAGEVQRVGQGGLFYTGSFHQLGAQAVAVTASFVTVFVLSYGSSGSSRRPSACASRRGRSWKVSTSASTACGATPNRSCRCPAGLPPADTPTVNPHALHEPVSTTQGVASA